MTLPPLQGQCLHQRRLSEFAIVLDHRDFLEVVCTDHGSLLPWIMGIFQKWRTPVMVCHSLKSWQIHISVHSSTEGFSITTTLVAVIWQQVWSFTIPSLIAIIQWWAWSFTISSLITIIWWWVWSFAVIQQQVWPIVCLPTHHHQPGLQPPLSSRSPTPFWYKYRWSSSHIYHSRHMKSTRIHHTGSQMHSQHLNSDTESISPSKPTTYGETDQ